MQNMYNKWNMMNMTNILNMTNMHDMTNMSKIQNMQIPFTYEPPLSNMNPLFLYYQYYKSARNMQTIWTPHFYMLKNIKYEKMQNIAFPHPAYPQW